MAGQIAANAMEKVSETFSFAKKIPMLKKYTSDDDNPTPGYIYQEINTRGITYETINSCNSLLDYLVNRLKRQSSPYIKYKVLKILCYLASNGHSEFRSGLRHKADVLREAEGFTGQMDYLKGDAPNQRVRTTASELIGLLFNVESSGTSTIHAMTGPTGKKMEGFGNTPSQPTKSTTWLDSMRNFAERLPDASNLLKPKNDQANVPSRGGSGLSFVNYTDSSCAELDFKKFLGADNSLEESSEDEEAENTLSVEVHLVEEITSEGGIRNVPSKEALTQFTKRCSTLNIDKVLDALNQRLLEPITEVQLKSLHVLEHLLKSDIPDVASKMSRCCTNLQKIAQTENGSVLSKAEKILSIIKAKMEKEKMQQDAQKIVKDSERSRLTHSQDLMKLQNVGSVASLPSQQFAADDTSTLFSGMSLHTTRTPSRSKQFESPTTVEGNQRLPEVLDALQGLGLSSENRSREKDTSSPKSYQSSESDLGGLFCLTEGNARPTPVTPITDSVTDLFDPLCSNDANSAGHRVTQSNVTSITGLEKGTTNNTASKTSAYSPQLKSNEGSLVCPLGNASNVYTANPVYTGFTGSIHCAVNAPSGSHTFGGLDSLSRNRPTQPNVTLPGNAFPMTNPFVSTFPNTSHPIVQPSVLSGSSTIPLRLPPPSQRTDFSFVGKSGKADTFSFVQDEMKARK